MAGSAWSQPARLRVGVDPESILEDLAWRVARTDASLAGSMKHWRDWSRLEVYTGRAAPRRAGGCVRSHRRARSSAPSSARAGRSAGVSLARIPTSSAWGRPVSTPEPMPSSWAAVTASRRPSARRPGDYGPAPPRWPASATTSPSSPVAPSWTAPRASPMGVCSRCRLRNRSRSTTASMLRSAALQVGRHLADRGATPGIDARTALRASIGSLASVMGATVDGIEIGASCGSRTLARTRCRIRPRRVRRCRDAASRAARR